MNIQTVDLKNLKIETETLEALDLLAQWQSLSRVQVIQQLLREGARQARIEYVAGLYGRGEVTLERAAEMAGVTIYDMMAHVRMCGIMPPGDLAELRTDVANMLLRLGYSDLVKQVVTARAKWMREMEGASAREPRRRTGSDQESESPPRG